MLRLARVHQILTQGRRAQKTTADTVFELICALQKFLCQNSVWFYHSEFPDFCQTEEQPKCMVGAAVSAGVLLVVHW